MLNECKFQLNKKFPNSIKKAPIFGISQQVFVFSRRPPPHTHTTKNRILAILDNIIIFQCLRNKDISRYAEIGDFRKHNY